MKLRTTAVYFLVLLLIGGIYFGIKAEQNKAARKEKASRRVFTFNAGAVNQIEIDSGQNKEICLEKTDRWRISRPITSDVDNMQFSGLFSTLQKIERERSIGKPSGSLKAFGLDKPSLVVRFLAGGKWLELRAGGENPAETDWYAMAGKGGEVFLISGQTYNDLNKTLKDLRRKELFSWDPGQVSAVNVKWQDGDGFSLERQGDSNRWKSESQPQLRIRTRKVLNLLNGLHWLRAMDFPGKDAMPSSPEVEIKLQLQGGKTAELKVATPGTGGKQTVATSSEVQGPVLVATNFLASIPRSVASLVDRSLISSDASDLRKITWKTSDGSGNLVWMDYNDWGTKEGAAAPKALRNSLPVRSFLAFINNVEYIKTVQPGVKPPQDAPNSIRFIDVLGKKSSLAWNGLDPKNTGPVNAWLQRDGSTKEVEMKDRDVQRLDESLAKMCPAAKEMPSKQK